jgi:hypothetical protein
VFPGSEPLPLGLLGLLLLALGLGLWGRYREFSGTAATPFRKAHVGAKGSPSASGEAAPPWLLSWPRWEPANPDSPYGRLWGE